MDVLLFTSYLLLVTCFLLLVSCFLLLVTCYLLLVTCCLLLVTCYLLLVTFYLLEIAIFHSCSASRHFYDALHNAYGIRGNIFLKTYIVNAYLFPKIWFTAQFCKLDGNIIKKILSKALAFIYAGENEKQ